MRKWIIGKYIRLSLADRDLLLKEGKTESESVAHQKALIQNYIDNDEELSGCAAYEFFDDGYSGTNFARPSFEKLIGQIKTGAVNCVIVKDFSRFGRDYIELGDYLERIFPFMGVRFISINDHYDSADFRGTTGGPDVVMKNIVYDYYSKDLSVKAVTAKRSRMKKGQYLGGHVPYGYRRCPEDKHRLEIEPEAAAIVREIFDMALAGKGSTEIARILSDKGYETPSAYYRRMNPGSKKFRNVSEFCCWDYNSVVRILRNRVHYGAYVGHKREAIKPCSRHTASVPEDEQIIVEGMHPGTVSKEEFMKVQQRFSRNPDVKADRGMKRKRPLSGKAVCGVCGRTMYFKAYTRRGKKYSYLFCSHAMTQVDAACTHHFLREADVNEFVWQSARNLMDLVDSAEKKIGKRKEEVKNEKILCAEQLAELQRDKEECEAERFANVDRYMAGERGKEEYQKARAVLTRRAERLDGEIKELEGKIREAELAADDGVREAVGTLKRYAGETELTREIVVALVEKVVIYDPEHMEIRWKFSDEVMKALEG